VAWTYRCEYVRCGKSHCSGCPHGPYWYGYERRDGKLHKKYFGKPDPRPCAQAEEVGYDIPVFYRTTREWCLGVLEVQSCDDFAACKRAYNRLCLKHHPDRGGVTRLMARVNHAWERLNDLNGWKKRY
jgi:hypothetical protein